MSIRHRLAAALLAVGVAAPAHAQFTAAVAPRREKPPEQVAAETQAASRADTARRTQLSEMRAWVDSAAKVATGRAVIRPDSTPAPVPATSPDTSAHAHPVARVPGAKVPGAKVPGATVPAATVPEATVPGATVPMPDTATPLPLIALAGLLLMLAGAAMVRGQPARARRRSARDA